MTLNGTENNFYFLNRDDRWADFTFSGLVMNDEGILHLATVPKLISQLPWRSNERPMFVGGGAGLAIEEDGTLYFTQPGQDQLLRIDNCNKEETAVSCISSGQNPTQLKQPRGLAIDPERHGLYVADSGNGRIQLFDLDTFQLLGVWEGFENPVDVTITANGELIVLDAAVPALYKMDRRGRWRSGFAHRVQKFAQMDEPVSLVASTWQETVVIYVLDAGRNQVLMIAEDGRLAEAFGAEYLKEPMGIAVTNDAIYVGDNQLKRILKFNKHPPFAFVGTAFGFDGPVAALTANGEHLWVHIGNEYAPLLMAVDRAFIQEGVCWGGPFKAPRNMDVKWHRLKAMVDQRNEETSLQMFSFAGENPPSNHLDEWQSLPLNVDDGLVWGDKANAMWVGLRLTGDGGHSPFVRQMMLTYDQDTYRAQLPAFYSRDKSEAVFLDRFLSLFETIYADVESEIGTLDQYADPAATPSSWLPWLANWVALPLDDVWSEKMTRTTISSALTWYHQRGTVSGLRMALKLFAGVDAVIEEPIQYADWWWSDDSEDTAVVGFSTRLASVYPGSAILGSTAVLDGVHLIPPEDYGEPLFGEIAHRFTVYLYQSQASEETLADVHQVLALEKPAHTAYAIEIIEPTMQLGLQARLGVDAVLADCDTPDPRKDNAGLQIHGTPAVALTEHTRLGKNTTI